MPFNLYFHNKIFHSHTKFFKKKKTVKVIDRCVIIAGILSPLCSLPQIIKIIEMKSADEISTLSWLLYLVFGLTWLTYGVVHKNLALILNNSLWVIAYLVIIYLSIIY